jgi:hypothetical protein
MISIKHKVLLLFVLFSLKLVSHVPPKKTPGAGIRIFFGPAYGFYQLNKNHAKDPVSKMSALAGFRKEIRCDREFKFFFLFGADYFFHTVGYKSYYFKPDSLKLYDKEYAYDHSLFLHEIQLPLQVKFSFRRENNSVFSPYVMFGYHLRYLLPGTLTISQNGNKVISDAVDVQFKNKLFHNTINSGLNLSVGWQKNSVNNSRGSFMVELNTRYGFSPYFFTEDYAASSLNMNSVHLSLLLGLKF